MALLQRTRILPQQRIDLPDFNNIEDFICADFKAIHKNVWTNENLVYSGFEATGTGTSDLVISLAGSSVVVGKDDGTLYIGAASLADLSTDALTPAATNYVELIIEQDTGGADSRAFWDQTAAAGDGGEFSQIVDTFIFSKATLAINTSNFTGDSDKVTICEVDVNGSGVITAIRDSRNQFWRLGKATDVNNVYNWASRTEPANTQFSGADKDIKNLKEFIDAVMSRILEISGTTYWYEDAGVSLAAGFRNAAMSAVTALGNNVTWAWSGTELSLSDDNVTPADADTLAAVRFWDSPADILLTRMDGTGGSTTIPLADGEVLWIELPDPIASVTIDDTGLTSTNYRVSARGSVPNDDKTFWIAFREGTNLYIRNQGELEPGETAEISDNINENILQAIGIPTETSLPTYTSVTTVTQNSSLVDAISALDAAAGSADIAANQDRSSKVIEGGVWSVNLAGDALTLSASAFVDLPEVTRASNEIAAQTISLPNVNSVAYVEINRATGAATLTVNVADIDAVVPTQNTQIIARRTPTGILVGTHSFLLKAGERLELDGALAEINRYFGQLRILEHPTDKDRVQITGVDITKLDGSTLAQSLKNLLLDFDGAEIDFETGSIFASDGTTPLGIDFTPATVAANQYQWYSITVLPNATNANGTIGGQILVLPGANTGATADLAERAPFANGIQLGQVVVQRNAGDTAFEDIAQTAVVQLGIGSGSGSGGGSGSVLTADIKRRLALSPYCYATPNEIQLDSDTKINTTLSTAAFSFADDALKFSTIGSVLVSNELLDADFLAQGKDLTKAEVMFRWQLDSLDPLATYEVSRDGGNEYQAVTMTRIGETDTYEGTHEFADEASLPTSIGNGASDGTVTLTDSAGANEDASAAFTVSNTTTLKELPLSITKNGATAGRYTLKIVNDAAGSPSTDINDVLFESPSKSIDDLAAGVNATQLDFTLTLAPGTYHVVLTTDQEYKDAYTLSTANNITLPTTGGDLSLAMNARDLSLLLRVTSGTVDVLSEGYGVFYDQITGVTDLSLENNIQKFFFSGNENRTVFEVPFLINPEIIELYDPLRGQVYVPAEGVCRVEGNSIVFEPNTFDFPGEDIVLVARQIKGNGFDNSDQNANNIAIILNQLIDIGDQLESVSDSMVVPKIAAPFTEVLNRSLMHDLSIDLKPRLGVERIMTQELYKIQGEVGASGESVYGVINDKFNQIRVVGNWTNANGGNGAFLVSTTINDFIEITFFGTGLNMLTIADSVEDVRVTVDGGAEGPNILANQSTMLAGRQYASNVVTRAASGLALGIHTVKIRHNGPDFGFSGFEILNEEASGNVVVNPGAQLFKGRRLVNPTQTSLPYNSDFESGTLGTAGGHVLVYQKSDGSIAKAVNPVDDALGSELVTNGTFDVDIAGWVKTGPGSGTITHSGTFGGSLNYNDTDAAGYHQANQIITTIPGKVYEISYDVKSISSSTVSFSCFIGDSATALDGNGFIPGASRWLSVGTFGAQDALSFKFRAQSSSARIQFGDGNAAGNTIQAFLDNISVRETTIGALSMANHSNEEVIRKINFREFGAGRADDLSSLTGGAASDRAFTLDDGTTTLIGENVNTQGSNIAEGVAILSGGFVTLTFVGTGLDVIVQNNSPGQTMTGQHTITVDGATIATGVTAVPNDDQVQKIVSGLSYGTHTVKIAVTSSVFNYIISDFIVYGPKTPTLPTGAKAISDYFVMADFSKNSTATLESMSTGVLRKDISREMTYVEGTGGTTSWGLSFVPSAIIGGYQSFSNRVGAYMEYTFFGTGFDLRWAADTGRSSSVDVTLNGVAASAANFPTAEYFEYGGTTARWNTGLGSLSMFDTGPHLGVGAGISNLPLGTYTVRFSNNNAGSFIVPEALDILTPIHSPKINGPRVLQAANEVGSQGIRDLRKFSKKDVIVNANTAVAATVNPGIGIVSTTPVPMSDSFVAIKTEGGDLEIEFQAPIGMTGSSGVRIRLMLDGKVLTEPVIAHNGQTVHHTIRRIVPAAAGWHTVQAFWSTQGGSANNSDNSRFLTVTEKKVD